MGISYPAPEKACYGQISADKYVALETILKGDKDASNLAVNGDTGTVTYNKIDFAWTYDPAACELVLTIVADHNWKAKIAGNQAIFGIIFDQLISKL
jgi:hypothetical protein